MYWMCGLSSFLFILSYNITVPDIYKFKSYKHFIESEGTLSSLRLDAASIAKLMENKRGKNKVKAFEETFFESDLKLIKAIAGDKVKDSPEHFYALKERSKYSLTVQRFFVALTMIIPAYLLPTIIVLNIFSVGNVAHTQIVEKGSLYNAVFNIN